MIAIVLAVLLAGQAPAMIAFTAAFLIGATDQCNFPAKALHVGPAFVQGVTSARPAVVDVTVDYAGHVVDTKIVRQSDSTLLDRVAIATAKTGDYAPGAAGCALVGGVVRVTIPFESRNFDCDRDVTVQKEVVPGVPPSVWTGQPSGAEKTATVQVNVGPDGKLVSEQIVGSTGIEQLDQAALDAARQSKYIPKMVRCKPVPGSALFKVSFYRPRP